jgi:hypothetical protein
MMIAEQTTTTIAITMMVYVVKCNLCKFQKKIKKIWFNLSFYVPTMYFCIKYKSCCCLSRETIHTKFLFPTCLSLSPTCLMFFDAFCIFFCDELLLLKNGDRKTATRDK